MSRCTICLHHDANTKPDMANIEDLFNKKSKFLTEKWIMFYKAFHQNGECFKEHFIKMYYHEMCTTEKWITFYRAFHQNVLPQNVLPRNEERFIEHFIKMYCHIMYYEKLRMFYRAFHQNVLPRNVLPRN